MQARPVVAIQEHQLHQLHLTRGERGVLGDAMGSGWLSDGLADDPASPIDLDGWLQREETLAGVVEFGVVDCRDDLDLRMLLEAFEASPGFAGLDCMRPKLERPAGRPERLPPEFT